MSKTREFRVGDGVKCIHKDTINKRIIGQIGTIITIGGVIVTVQFDEFIAGHSGLKRNGKDGHCWNFSRGNINKYLELVGNKFILITTDGVETKATLEENGKVIKTATAKCHSEDTFDFNVGAKLAFERLIDEWKVVNRKARVGDYIRLNENASFTFNRVGDILQVDGWSKSCVYVFGKNHPRDTGDSSTAWHYTEREYEVVERITEEKTPEYYNGEVVCVKSVSSCFIVGKIYKFVDGQVRDEDGDLRPVGHPIKTLDEYSLYKFIPYKGIAK